ncbi:MAG: thiaminase II [Gaiellales bacterium]
MTKRSPTSELWAEIEPIFEAIIAHPFLQGLVHGDLPHETFRHYVIQDGLYLHTYARALSALGGRAPTTADTEFFSMRAGRVVSVERTLHRELAGTLGVTPDELARAELSPSALAYTSFIMARVHGSSFADGLASVLPCFWIYREVAARLVEQGSPDPAYQRWISSYDSPEFQAGVEGALALMDRVGADLAGDDLETVRATFVGASRYEWMFWDAAWRREAWPISRSGAQPAH